MTEQEPKRPELFPILDTDLDWRLAANKLFSHYPDNRPTTFNHIIDKKHDHI